MIGEKASPLFRYMGPGEEGHHYTVFLQEPLAKGPGLDALIDRELQYAQSLNRKAWWWKIHDFPPSEGLPALLEQKGFSLYRKCRLLYKVINPRELQNVTPQTQVSEVNTKEGIEILHQINSTVWGSESPEMMKTILTEALQPVPRTKIFITRSLKPGYDKWASGGWIKFYGKIGFLFGGSTLSEFRGLGAYRASVSARMLEAQKNGIKYVVSECTPESEAVLRRLGFEDAGSVSTYQFLR